MLLPRRTHPFRGTGPNFAIVHADLPQILDLIDADASFNAIETLQWIVDGRLLDAGAGNVSPLWERPRVIALLQDRFVKDPKIARVCWVIGSSWNPEEAAPRPCSTRLRSRARTGWPAPTPPMPPPAFS